MGDGYEQVKEQIQLLLRKLEELEVIEYGEGLYGVVIEKMTIYLQLIDKREELQAIRIVKNEEEKALWDAKYEDAQQLSDKINSLADRQAGEVKMLLDQYNMKYIEKEERGIQYYYHDNTIG